METVKFKSPDGKKEVVIFARQVFAVTQIESGTTCIVGPQNAVMFVSVTVEQAELAIKQALNNNEESKGQ